MPGLSIAHIGSVVARASSAIETMPRQPDIQRAGSSAMRRRASAGSARDAAQSAAAIALSANRYSRNQRCIGDGLAHGRESAVPMSGTDALEVPVASAARPSA